jgi:hypothetical protein
LHTDFSKICQDISKILGHLANFNLETIYNDFWGPLSLVSTIEELLGRKISGSGLENRDYGHRDPLR